MEVRHEDGSLERLETEESYNGGFDRIIVRGFRKTMNLIRNAPDERELLARRGLRLERLKGNRSHEHSLRINQQWRLIVEFEEGTRGSRIVIKKIEDYH